MADAELVYGAHDIRPTAEAAVNVGELWQHSDGRAGYYISRNAATSGTQVRFSTTGQVNVTKTAGVVLLKGGKAYWDHSANAVTYKPSNDRDFFVGTLTADAASADTTCTVNLNILPKYTLDIFETPCASILVGSPAAGGFGYPITLGGCIVLELDTTNEAQKVDLLSTDGIATTANGIIEGSFRVLADGAGSAPDFSMGLASATHASDADSIAESLFIHLNGNDVNIYAESDDGTTEVAATDTTIDYTEGSTAGERVEFWWDMRTPTNCKLYVNGVARLTGSTFNVNAAVGPWKLLAHLEKTAAADTYKIAIDKLNVRTAEQ